MEAQAAEEACEAPLPMEAQAAAEESEAPLPMEAQAAAEESEAPLHMEAQAAAEEREAPLHMEAQAAAEESEAPLRSHSFPFGCVLDGISRKVFFPGSDDLDEQLTLRTVSLGLGAPDVLHVLEVEGETQEGSVVRVPVASLRPSLLTSVYLGGLELTPPVTLWLTAGTGPVHISGQHLVAITESEAAAAKESANRETAQKEERRTLDKVVCDAAVQTLSSPDFPPLRLLSLKTVESMKEKLVSLSKHGGRIPIARKSFKKFVRFTFGKGEPAIVQHLWEFVLREKLNEPPLIPESSTPLIVEQMQEKLVSLSLNRVTIPKTQVKFRRYARCHLGTEDPQIVQQLWEFVLSEKLNKPPALISEWTAPMTVDQMKEILVSISLKPGRIPKTQDKFQKFARLTFRIDEPRIVQQLWEFVQSEILHMPPPTGERKSHLSVERMKGIIDLLSSKRGYLIPKTFKKFRKFARFTLFTDDPRIVQQLWEFAREKCKEAEAGAVGFWADD